MTFQGNEQIRFSFSEEARTAICVDGTRVCRGIQTPLVICGVEQHFPHPSISNRLATVSINLACAEEGRYNALRFDFAGRARSRSS
jgi:hypothetical protein